jgi:hypothetical protein
VFTELLPGNALIKSITIYLLQILQIMYNKCVEKTLCDLDIWINIFSSCPASSLPELGKAQCEVDHSLHINVHYHDRPRLMTSMCEIRFHVMISVQSLLSLRIRFFGLCPLRINSENLSLMDSWWDPLDGGSALRKAATYTGQHKQN